MLQHALQALLVAGVLSPFSYYAGHAARRLRLPQITGYLVSGILCGPYVLGLLSSQSVSDLTMLEGGCLGIIGLAAGAELHLAELNRAKKQVRARVRVCMRMRSSRCSGALVPARVHMAAHEAGAAMVPFC